MHLPRPHRRSAAVASRSQDRLAPDEITRQASDEIAQTKAKEASRKRKGVAATLTPCVYW